MRLKSIKLAGFKSFVDPTTVNFPGNLSAVVGPNGCGKSNIIDAVRWVMGESSAKNLRGESMTDVIFNGSRGRKPIGQASIELVFDNSDGSLGGEYASFSEIAIKRRVTREAQNQYFLNGEKCRRRDITDIFLGTGLGPRSYAIIEQGMISRLIESKPEELRVFVEEAAGISKYKERRRDTENRMRRTLENLDRLTDIRDELGRQLQHLHRQAQSAEKYQTFKAEERLLKAQLQALQWRDLDHAVSARQEDIQRFELDVEAAVTRQTALDSRVETLFTQSGEARDSFNLVQGQFYNLGAEIARAEQSLQHQKERHKQLYEDLAATEESYRQAESMLLDDKARLEEANEELMELEPEVEILAETEESSQMQLLDVEERMQQWQNEWDAFNVKAADARQKAEVQQSRIQHGETVMARMSERLQRFDDDIAELSMGDVDDDIAMLQENLSELELTLEADQETLQTLQDTIEQLRHEGERHRQSRDQFQSQLQSAGGRMASLEALQQSAMAQDNDHVSNWLAANQLQNAATLADQLDVESGWEQAVETVLAAQLQSVCLDEAAINQLAPAASDLSGGIIQILEPYGGQGYAGQHGLMPLQQKITGSAPVDGLLAGIFIADDLEHGLKNRSHLAANESIIMPDGLWLGPNWLRCIREEDAAAGVFKRKQAIEVLAAEISELTEAVDGLDETVQANREQLLEKEHSLADAQQRFKQAAQQQSSVVSQLAERKGKVEQVLQRKAQLIEDQRETCEQLLMEQETIAEARGTLEDAIEAMDADTARREQLVDKREDARRQLDMARESARTSKDRAHQLAMREQSLRSQVDSLAQSLLRAEGQLEQLVVRKRQLQADVSTQSDPDESLEQELEALLDKRLGVEEQLAEARRRVDGIDHDMRDADRERNTLIQEVQEHRTRLEQARLASQGFQVQRDNLNKQLVEAEFDLKTVLDGLPEEANEPTWQEQIEKIASKISRLGAINLAAIDEYKHASERKNYLDQQDEDLKKALQTLENAIRKIDRETRLRFKDTFDRINAGVQELFPKVFGGGRAYLEMTGDDLLDTGIAIMAQPPGKRNSTIHLLSGGEKALTAIALVFSIFRLNPAPFCMLDEVDAPLDDANVGRYARIVKEMSDQVQFIYITHNKIAMEMASHLLGVTMHEPGVSRMVAVDVEEAAELAAM
ncbi:Chromosome partition protein Smc [BD1-7 clade bacterium]|uniref:Chromosome partition protein Smc n=1 Tax=BD1-7 clade bacterium TaxID=2029982 RepID=A0A5S9Q7F5_9GAMM|nr:Chromosome partition protein Smc [BD1-7 clade bacterium]CAA0114448.1 Chromosome partition protein Smc [BD1-7 clade bacterium]